MSKVTHQKLATLLKTNDSKVIKEAINYFGFNETNKLIANGQLQEFESYTDVMNKLFPDFNEVMQDMATTTGDDIYLRYDLELEGKTLAGNNGGSFEYGNKVYAVIY